MNLLKDIDEVRKYWAHIWHDGGHTPFLFWNAVVLGEHLVYECQSDAKSKKQGTKLKQQTDIFRNSMETKYLGNILHFEMKETIFFNIFH